MPTQRLILWIIFSMSLLFLWDAWQRHQGQPTLFGPQPQKAESAAGSAGAASTAAPSPNAPAKQAAGVDPSIPTGPVALPIPGGGQIPTSGEATATRNDVIRLSNDVLALDIDPVGGQIRRGELLRHRDTSAQTNNVLLFDLRANSTYLAQSGLIGAPEGQTFPNHRSAMRVVDAGLPRELGRGGSAAGVTLIAESGGVRFERMLKLARGSYVLEVSDRVTNTGGQTVSPVLYMQLTRDSNPPPGGSDFYSTYVGPVIYTDKEKFQKVDFSDIEKGKARHPTTANDGWLGIIQHYFVSAWIPADKLAREFYTRKVDAKLYSVGAKVGLGEIAPGASTTIASRLLAGPQDQRMLETIAPGLDLAVDYGFLTVIAKPIFWLLEKLHGLVGNWGWAIVLLTIVIKTVFYPLQAASYRSMARMKAVTPRLIALRERYGEDRVRLNQAMMELYKTEKINPLGGCLPIVVQIPVFIALYWVLLSSVEMRDAPWIGWIQDLAAPDTLFGTIPGLDMPIGLLPILMAVTMFIQTKLNPTPPDPIQAKLMMFMPLIFSVMFFFFPAGLVLYWLVNNIYSIIQQWLITRSIENAKKVG
ncbi:MAG: membrane protein insertase YidC [Betaproteobacteria bacterium]|nr:membrane protein insertase YidC [Betaproteobacteria bacterium]